MEVSIYRDAYDTKGETGDLFAFLTTTKWKELSLKVRQATNKDERNKLKKQLPSCTPSGIFRPGERNKKGLVQHSGYICIDIDAKENPSINDWNSFCKKVLALIKSVAFAGLSASGKGAFCLIKISDPTQHESHFKAIEEDFFKCGIVVDPACKDVTRLRFYAYNEHPYINKDASTYTRTYKQKVKAKSISKKFYSNNGDDDVVNLVKKIVDTHTNIVPDYESWFEVGASLANVPNGRGLFHAISQIDATKYNRAECDKQFDKIKAGAGIGINTLFYHAKNHGIELKKH